MNILFLSASTPAALALARVLAAEGHTVYAVDEERIWGTSPARYSRAYTRFHRISSFNTLSDLWLAIGSSIDLVITFGGIPEQITGLKDGGADMLGHRLFQDEYEFQDFVRDKVLNTPNRTPSVVKVPVTFAIHSRTCIAEILSCYPSTTFSLQPAAYNATDYDDDEDTLVDLSSLPSPTTTSSSSSTCMSLQEESPLILSCSTLDDATVEAIKDLPMSDAHPYRLTEMVDGGTEYSAHTLINGGHIRTFIVTTPASAQGTREQDFIIVPSSEALFTVLYKFTKRLVDALEPWHEETTYADPRAKKRKALATHITLKLSVKEEVRNGELVRRVMLLSCSNQPHPSLIFFCKQPSLRRDLALAYTTPELASDAAFPLILTSTQDVSGIYSFPAVFVEVIRILRGFAPWTRRWWARVAYLTMMCWVWAVCFEEEMWDAKDPGPALCLWTRMLVTRVIEEVGRLWWVGVLRRVFRSVWKRV